MLAAFPQGKDPKPSGPIGAAGAASSGPAPGEAVVSGAGLVVGACGPGGDRRGNPGQWGTSLLEVLAGERTAKPGNVAGTRHSKLPQRLQRGGAWSGAGVTGPEGVV